MACSRARPAFLTGVGIAVILGCSGGGGTTGESTRAKETTPPATKSAQPSSPSPSDDRPAAPKTGDQRQHAWLTIEAIGVKNLRVVPYEGTTDDWPGTRIQNRGFAASPYGKQGGVGPGEIGNYLVTAHRLSAGGPLRLLPSLDEGERVVVTAAGARYEYEITDTRETSFRSARSLAEQRAAVPGVPGQRPTQAMITVSTCLTPEDNAAGNYWRDDRGNPEHRVDKIGVLTSAQPAQ
ncbi:class E sortase [Streptomyces sp. NPDC050211]|uniref:class E sortase n=1 Tax=Streptomyces sp. NPDC050211 TaxID=3154932 RepID=UPI00342EB608